MVWQQFQKKVTKVLAGSATKIALGLGLMAIAPSFATAMPTNSDTNTYLFGTTPEAGQIGHDYIVMQLGEENSVKGAFYQVSSEYACFSGKVANGKLDLAVVDPYEQVAYEHQLNYEESALVANTGEHTTTQIVPEGFHLIDIVSNLANSVLAQCGTEAPLEI
ncbi:hypothetical protein [[Limnothrix rosea] IAM M-220]|uniref:hypothetical protein n=1 Tax=[Limnothrix rosea] IAM M-220 TaxID=454133 RepID=UPI0009673811|nr:hypothetical protein [[Limnothrix rosea] IAM M-220]OKH17889.1 hypothetical protein NIES208_07790 [[Limnothrix rosea] IAM M-220]